MSRDLNLTQRKSESFRGSKPGDGSYTSRRLPPAFSTNGIQQGVLVLPSPGKTPQKPPQRRSPPITSPSTPPKNESHPLSCCQPAVKKEAIIADLYQEYFTKKPDSLCTPDIRETTDQTQSKLLKPVNDHHFDVPVKPKFNSGQCAASLADYTEKGSLTKDGISKRSLLWKMAGSLRSADSIRFALASLSVAVFFALVILCLLMLQIIIRLESCGDGFGGLVPT